MSKACHLEHFGVAGKATWRSDSRALGDAVEAAPQGGTSDQEMAIRTPGKINVRIVLSCHCEVTDTRVKQY